MAKFIKFPKEFLWGGASAAEQAEGHGDTNKGRTVWDSYYDARPQDFYDQVGPAVTSDFFHHYKEDLKLFASFNANSVRLGISWARVVPDGKVVSKKGLAFYHDVIKHANANNIKVVLNLFHFDMPEWAQNLGGWESQEVINKFVQFAHLVFSEFGNKVDWIATMNEPIVPIIGGYLAKFHWPLIVDQKRAFQAGYGTILAHARAVNLFNDKFRDKVKAKIGFVININPAIALDGINPSKADLKAAEKMNILHNWSMLYPMAKGKFHPKVVEFVKKHKLTPNYSDAEIQEIARIKLDYIGVNYYAPTRVKAPTKKHPETIFEQSFDHYHYDKARYNVFRGWEIRPETLYDLSMFIKKELDNIPFFISENGMGVEGEDAFRGPNGEIQDDYRIAFLQEHLQQLNKAMEDGANCFGYHMWAITDNWSWRNAYKNRYGFVEINIKTQERRLKKSAHWFKEMIAQNGFSDDFAKIEDVLDLKNAKYTPSV